MKKTSSRLEYIADFWSLRLICSFRLTLSSVVRREAVCNHEPAIAAWPDLQWVPQKKRDDDTWMRLFGSQTIALQEASMVQTANYPKNSQRVAAGRPETGDGLPVKPDRFAAFVLGFGYCRM